MAAGGDEAPSREAHRSANYAAEPGILGDFYEGNVGIKLSENNNLWLNIGVFPSQPFSGLEMIGYNNLLKRYVTSWMSPRGTGCLCGTSRGPLRSRSKVE